MKRILAAAICSLLAGGALLITIASSQAAARPMTPLVYSGRAPAICSPHWQMVPGPPIGTSLFAGVTVASSQAVWMVGSVGKGTAERPLAARWNGSGWLVDTRLPAQPASSFFAYGSGSALAGVAALSPDDFWAVGTSATSTGTRPLVARWTDGRWRVFATPNAGPNARLVAVAAVSARDVWAVGDIQGRRILAEHWDGRSWRLVPMPHLQGQEALLTGIAALSTADVWVAGSQGNVSDGTRRALVEHWDGRRWTVVPSAQPGVVDDALNGIAAAAPDDVWAVGSAEGNDYQIAPFVERWDGRTWRAMAPPRLPPTQLGLDAVAVRSTRDVWAAGDASLAHWTGARWQTTTLRTSSYQPGGDVTMASLPEFSAITVAPDGRVWAVGGIMLQTDELHVTLIAYDDAPGC